jgi:hypothetical protein
MTIRATRRSFILGTIGGVANFRGSTTGCSTTPKPDSTRSWLPGRSIRVRAVDGKTSARLKGARVFVIGGDGCQLSEAWTDAEGIAVITQLPATSQPKYVLVDYPFYYVTGRLWLPNLEEYDMRMSGLTPPGFLG